jgi:hypothetical protein
MPPSKQLSTSKLRLTTKSRQELIDALKLQVETWASTTYSSEKGVGQIKELCV